MLIESVDDPAIVLLPSSNNSDTIITYDSSLTQLINISFTVIPLQFHQQWQMLIDLRQRRIFHGVDNTPEKINFNGMDVVVQDTDIGHLNIIIAGKSGAGKTTLLNTILGSEVSREGVGNSITHTIKEFDVENKPELYKHNEAD